MPIYPTDYTQSDYESDMAELRREDRMKEAGIDLDKTPEFAIEESRRTSMNTTGEPRAEADHEFAQEDPIDEQATDERTFADARTHVLRASVYVEMFLEKQGTIKTLEKAHEAATKAFNTVLFLEEQQPEFTVEDIGAAWRDGYEAAREE